MQGFWHYQAACGWTMLAATAERLRSLAAGVN